MNMKVDRLETLRTYESVALVYGIMYYIAPRQLATQDMSPLLVYRHHSSSC